MRPSTSLLSRLLTVVGLPLVLMVVAAATVAWQLQRIADANAALDAGRRQREVVTDWMAQVHVNLDKAILATRLDAAAGDDAKVRERLGPAVNRLNDEMARAATSAAQSQARMSETAAGHDPKVAELVQLVAGHREKFVTVRGQIRDDLLMGDGQARIDAELEPLAQAMRASLKSLHVHLGASADAASRRVAANVRDALAVLALSCLLALAAGSVVAWRLSRSIVRRMNESARFARSIAAGDLAVDLDTGGSDETAELARSMIAMRDALRSLVGDVRRSADSVGAGSAEVAGGNLDLSQRTEHAADSLQQVASSMHQLTSTVTQTADSARTASELAASASEVARRGGDVVTQVVATMADIEAGSHRIADITGVIDGIAFQTNILALNAAVEAARAGEQGRGFAVVAGEVRSLAQRSAEAAREIKALIGASVAKVEGGSRLVGDAGRTMQEIVASVQRVSDLIGEISHAAAEQSGGIGLVGSAVSQLDQLTQQNAALVHRSAAAAQGLGDQALRLKQVAARFRTGTDPNADAPAAAPAAAARTPLAPAAASHATPAKPEQPAPPAVPAAPATPATPKKRATPATRATRPAAAGRPPAADDRAVPTLRTPLSATATSAAGDDDGWESF